jgi:predicted O-methyltransferase YrrM
MFSSGSPDPPHPRRSWSCGCPYGACGTVCANHNSKIAGFSGSADAIRYGRCVQADHEWRPPRSYDEVKGWFYPRDRALFTWLLNRQERSEPPGDLLELGVFLGKSAILIGSHRRPGETFTVCDLFGSEPSDAANRTENARSYKTLTRQAFEGNYLSFHDDLPAIVQAATDQIGQYVSPGSCRLVHVDASHLWEHVSGDIQAAQQLLRADGVVVCDDFRSEHTPGVAAAVWNAVANEGLRPICVTGNKFYGTWGDPKPVQDELVEWLRSFNPGLPQYQNVLGHQLVRVCRWNDPPLPELTPLRLPEEEDETPVVEEVPVQPPVVRSRARALARELLPPVLTRALRRLRG